MQATLGRFLRSPRSKGGPSVLVGAKDWRDAIGLGLNKGEFKLLVEFGTELRAALAAGRMEPATGIFFLCFRKVNYYYYSFYSFFFSPHFPL